MSRESDYHSLAWASHMQHEIHGKELKIPHFPITQRLKGVF